jgi:hypothetical protein
MTAPTGRYDVMRDEGERLGLTYSQMEITLVWGADGFDS